MTDGEHEDDLHWVRMLYGAGAQAGMDMIDAEVLMALRAVAEQMTMLRNVMIAHGASQQTRLNLMISFAIAAALDEDTKADIKGP